MSAIDAGTGRCCPRTRNETSRTVCVLNAAAECTAILARVRSAAVALLLLAGTQASAQSAFSHQVPIKLPPGTNGMQPELALVYHPAGANSIAGVGWQLTGIAWPPYSCPGGQGF